MLLSKIHHIAIIGSNYDKTKDFYVNKLGFSVIRENYRKERNDWKIDLKLGETIELEVFIENNPPKRVSRPEACGLRHLAFDVENVEKTVIKLERMRNVYAVSGAAVQLPRSSTRRSHMPAPVPGDPGHRSQGTGGFSGGGSRHISQVPAAAGCGAAQGDGHSRSASQN